MKHPTCHKICYKTADKAWLAASRMYVKNLTKAFNVYVCPVCKKFHWTSQSGELPQKVEERLKRMVLIKKYFNL